MNVALPARVRARRRSLPRRRSELGLVLVGAIVVVFASLLPSLALTGELPLHEVSFLIGIGGAGLVVIVVNRRYAPHADPIMLPIALVLNGIGFVMISRLGATDPQVAGETGKQAAWSAIGILIYVLVLMSLKRSRDLERYRYLTLLVTVGLLVSPIVPKIGENIQGARLWLHLGPILVQPVEIAKLLLVFFLASYFIEKKEILSVATHRIGNHLVPDLRAFGPVAIAGAFALLVILAEHDIGFSLLLFIVFLSMLWVATGRALYLVVGMVLFIGGTWLAAHFLGQLESRISVWLDPWKDPSGNGFQPIAGELSFGRGGLFGTGLGLGLSGQGVSYLGSFAPNLPEASSDFIFSVIGEEMGLFGTVAIAVAYLLIVGSGIRAALTARSEFAKMVAFGLTTLFGFQAFLIMAGVTRLLPLTGVTLPFVSYGGSSLVANYALLAVLMRISNEANQPDVGNPTWSSTSAATEIGAMRR